MIIFNKYNITNNLMLQKSKLTLFIIKANSQEISRFSVMLSESGISYYFRKSSKPSSLGIKNYIVMLYEDEKFSSFSKTNSALNYIKDMNSAEENTLSNQELKAKLYNLELKEFPKEDMVLSKLTEEALKIKEQNTASSTATIHESLSSISTKKEQTVKEITIFDITEYAEEKTSKSEVDNIKNNIYLIEIPEKDFPPIANSLRTSHVLVREFTFTKHNEEIKSIIVTNEELNNLSNTLPSVRARILINLKITKLNLMDIKDKFRFELDNLKKAINKYKIKLCEKQKKLKDLQALSYGFTSISSPSSTNQRPSVQQIMPPTTMSQLPNMNSQYLQFTSPKGKRKDGPEEEIKSPEEEIHWDFGRHHEKKGRNK